MKKHFSVLSFLFLTLFVQLPVSGQSWERLFSKKSTDAFRSVREVPAGGYIMAGYTADSTANDSDFYVVRMTTLGDTMWTKRINGPASRKDLFYRVINTNDGGFAFCGYSTSYGAGSDDAVWAKMDAAGNMQWIKFWGGAGKDRAQDIVQTSDGGYAITGYTTSPPAQYYDAFIIRTNANGDTLWTRRYGTSAFDDANAIKQLPDNGFVIGGQSTNGANGLDMYLVRTNSNGDTLWTRKFGTIGTDNIEHIIRQPDGSFILAGGTDGPGFGGNDGMMVKTDTGGTVLWSKLYGGNSQDDFHQVEPTADGGFILSGTSRSYSTSTPSMWLVKTNSAGDTTWTRIFGRENHDHGYSAQQTLDGGYIFVGYSSSFGFNFEDAYVVKTNSLGRIGNFLTYTSISALPSPVSYSCGATNVQVRVVIRNYGRDTVPNVPVTVQISGAITQTLNQTYNGAVYPNDADTMTFSTTINTSSGGIFNFNCFTSNNNEVFPANNSLQTSIQVLNFSSPPVAVDGARCGTGSVVIGANSPDSIFWYNAMSGGTLLGTGPTFSTPSISSNTVYYAQAGFNCPSTRVGVNATILNTPAAPVTTSASRCGTGTLVLTASASDPVRWFDASSGGTQVGTGNSFTTPSLSSSTTYYAESFNAGCSSARIAATATIQPQAADPVTSSFSRCGSGTVTLSATASDPITWYDADSGGNVVGSGTSFTTPSISTTTTYWAQADNGFCPSSRIPATATIYSQVPDPVITEAGNCGPGMVTLSANSSATLIWYPTSSGGTQLGFGSTFTTPFLNTTTTYYVRAMDGACNSNYVPVTAFIYIVPTIDLGPDISLPVINYTIDAGPGFSQYLWSTTETTPSITVNTTGNYCVTVTDANLCTASDCIFIELTVGIDQLSNSNSIILFPNPGNGNFNLQFQENFSSILYSVFSAEGKMIQSGQLEQIYSGQVESFNLNGAANGIYLLRLESGDRRINKYLHLQR